MSFETIDYVWKWPHKPPTWSSELLSPIWQLRLRTQQRTPRPWVMVKPQDGKELNSCMITWKVLPDEKYPLWILCEQEVNSYCVNMLRCGTLWWQLVLCTLPHSHRLQAFMPWSQDPPRQSLWAGCIAILLINSENAKEKVMSFFNLLALILSALRRPTYLFILAFQRMVSGGYEQIQEWGGHWKFWKGSRVQNWHWAESCG